MGSLKTYLGINIHLAFWRSGFQFKNVRWTYEEVEIEELKAQGSTEVL